MAFTYSITVYENNNGSVLATTANCESISATYKIDESLDSALLVIPRSTRSTMFQRFAPVKISVSDITTTDTHWWLIYTPKIDISCYGTTKRYTHTLGLIEPTKWLEKFPCGSLTFTQPLGGTQYTMLDVVERLRQLAPFVPYSEVSTSRVFVIDATLSAYLDTITAPQFYLDKKNLREALVEVFKFINAIPRITITYPSAGVFTFTLTADYINNRHIAIDISSGIIDLTSENSGEDFAEKAEVYHENTVANDDTITPSTRCVEFVSFRNDQIVLGESDLRIILNNKVENLVFMSIFLENDAIVSEYDMADYIYEKKVYDTLEAQENDLTPYAQGTQSCAVYWTYGTNEILGFADAYGALFPQMAIDNIIAAIDVTSSTVPSEVVFRVEYDAYIDTMRSEQSREDDSDTKLFPSSFQSKYATLSLNAQERINNLFKLTNNVYGQIQRLGVDTVGFSKKHFVLAPYNGSNAGIYSLGDYTTDGFFVTAVELIFFNSFVIGRYEMSKNFNRIAQFMSIDKEFRPYEITLTKSDYTLKRNILMPFMTVVVASELNESHGSNLSANYTNLVTTFMNTFLNSTYSGNITGASFHIGATSTINAGEGVYLPIIAGAEKNTLKFKLDFNDTQLAGKRVSAETVGLVTAYHQKQVSYTDTDGTLDYAKIELYNAYWEYVADYVSNGDIAGLNALQGMRAIAEQFPYIDTTKNIATILALAEFLYVQNIYALEATFWDNPNARVVGEYYFGEDEQRVFIAIAAAPYYELVGYRVGLKNDAEYTLPIYKIDKDRSEILGLEMAIPIIAHKDEINRFIIGDMLTKENVLIKPRETARTLKWYVSNVPYTKANTNKIDITGGIIYSGTNVVGNELNVPSTITNYYETHAGYTNFALADSSGNLYLAVNQKNMDGTITEIDSVYFNFLTERM